jgi:hypothetical protein
MELIVNSYFSKNGIPKPGLSPTLLIWEVNENSESLVIPNDNMSEIGDGFYKYVFTQVNGYDETKRYVIRSDGNDNTLSNAERYTVGLTDESALSQATVDRITDHIWDETATDHISTGSTGLLLNEIKADTTQLAADHVIEISILDLLLKYERNKTKIDKNNFTLTIFDDNGTTPLTIFDLKDSAGNPSIIEICERVPQ